ncbi:MAG: phosphatidate cytidylyltransferase [Burkholderiales bacterium]|nr:phosphatidate cytidylyltransferase [Burkholderiales bacterium]
MSELRGLGVDRQVALLFVVLFGLLALASASAVFVALRRDEPEQGGRAERAGRELRVLWLGAAVFWLAWVSGPLGATLCFGAVSFLALREFITLAHTRRGDHRSLLLAFFAVLPLQYLMVGLRSFDLFSVFIPVYVFFSLPLISALAGDPERFLERNAAIQWGLMVCVYGLSHAPALLLLQFPGYVGRGAFLVFFLVAVTAAGQLAQAALQRRLRRRPLARHIDRRFSARAWLLATPAAGFVGAALYWITPFKPLQALALGLIAAGAGTLGGFVMKALEGPAGQRPVTGAVGLLDRVAPLCFAAPVFFHSARWYFSVRV